MSETIDAGAFELARELAAYRGDVVPYSGKIASLVRQHVGQLEKERDGLNVEKEQLSQQLNDARDQLYECTEGCNQLVAKVEASEKANAALKMALQSLKHSDGCFCEASFSGPGCHPRHSAECEQACRALSSGAGGDYVHKSVLPAGGVALIAIERQRQVTQEGWTPEHDDQHDCGELARAAAAYSWNASVSPDFAKCLFPFEWDPRWWKPSTPIRDLVKAGALIAAEIDRLQRIEDRAKEVSK